MLRLRHSLWLGRDLVAFAIVNRAWWFLPVTLAIGIAVAVVTAGATAAPYTIYTLF